jgi:hemolysin activation/secretion protein
VRVGGAKAWNPTPFFELPSIGGRRSVRSFDTHRFIGDAALFGSTEIRLNFGGFTLIAPGEWGIYGLGDLGRVYLDGEVSNRWHGALGGGLWFAFIDRRSTITATYAASREHGKFYLRAGFHF